jgi:hypothetical protein
MSLLLTFLKSPRKRFLSTLILTAAITVFALAGASATFAQTPCATPPVDTSHAVFRAGGTIWAQFDSTITADQRNQIRAGLSSWNDRNQANGSGVFFQDHDVPGEMGVDGVVTFTNGTLAPGMISGETYDSTHPDGTIASMTITFNTQGATVTGVAGAAPYYNPTLAGYDSIFRKNTEHGIGHPMGLNDMPRPQTAGASVMNNAVPNCPNDNCGNEPVGVTPCDGAAVSQVPYYAPPLIPPPGGGGDSGTCNSYCGGYYQPCTPYYWYYYESWDGGETWGLVDISYAGCW